MTHLDKLRALLRHAEPEQREQGAELAISLDLQDQLLSGVEWEQGVPLLPHAEWLSLVLASDQRGRVRGLPWVRLGPSLVSRCVEELPALEELNLLEATQDHLQRVCSHPWRRLGVRCASGDEDALKPLAALEQVEELDLSGPRLPHLRRCSPVRLRFAGQTTQGPLPSSLLILENLSRDLVSRHMAGLALERLDIQQAGHWSELPRSRLLRAYTASPSVADATTGELHVLHSFSGDPSGLPHLTWLSLARYEEPVTVPDNPSIRVLDLPLELEPQRPAGTRPSGLTVGLLPAPPPEWVAATRAEGAWTVRTPDKVWRKITGIKHFRHLTRLGLLAAKRHADPLSQGGCMGLDRRRAEELALAIEEAGSPAVILRT